MSLDLLKSGKTQHGWLITMLKILKKIKIVHEI